MSQSEERFVGQEQSIDCAPFDISLDSVLIELRVDVETKKGAGPP